MFLQKLHIPFPCSPAVLMRSPVRLQSSSTQSDSSSQTPRGNRAAVLSLLGTRDRFRGREFFHGRGNAGDGERWAAADEGSLARPPLTSCRAAWLLTGRAPVPVRGPGVGDPCDRGYFRPAIALILLVFNRGLGAEHVERSACPQRSFL